MPIARGLGFTLIPRPERFYFSVGEPIDTSRFAGRHDDPEALLALREEVRVAVEDGIAKMLKIREKDPRRTLMGSILHGPKDEGDKTPEE
jgi:hypothetical protein